MDVDTMDPSRRRGSEAGFNLLELMIVITIIALISTLLIPAVVKMLEKANQRATMADMRTLGNALLQWELEHGHVATPESDGASALDSTELSSMLVPEFLEHLRRNDAWKRPLRVLRGKEEEHGYRFLLWSAGRDGEFEELADLLAGEPFPTTEFDRDIVWSDGGFVAWPGAEGAGEEG